MHTASLLVLAAASTVSVASEPGAVSARISEIPGSPAMQLLAECRIPGTSTDKSGLTGKDRSGIAENLFGSWGSGIDWEQDTTTDADRAAGIIRGSLLAVCDRGPFDGASSFRCRVQRLSMTLTLLKDSALGTLTLDNTATYLLSGPGEKAEGEAAPNIPLVGSLDALSPALHVPTWTLGEKQDKPVATSFPARLDPESIRIAPAKVGPARMGVSWWVSDEYGPWIDVFAPVMVAATEGSEPSASTPASAVLDARILLPERYRVKNPGATYDAEMPPANTTGRAPNRGLESLAVSADGTTLYAITQSPLLQDNLLEGTRRMATNMRLLVIDLTAMHAASEAPSPTREYVYQLSHRGNGINELLVWDDSTLLVLERCGSPGEKAKKRTVYAIDLAQLAKGGRSTDVSNVDSLPRDELPASITPLAKQPWLDLLDPALGLKGAAMPEKIEGLAKGPALPDGRGLLLVSVDNDILPEQDNVVWAFAVGSKK